MIVKVKTIFFGCCGHSEDQMVNPTELEKVIKLVPPGDNSPQKKIQLKIETESATEAHNLNLTTSPSQGELTSKGPFLKLIAVEGDVVPLGKEFVISSKGVEFGGRRKLDGFTYIGRKKLAKDSNVVINDIVLEDASVGEKHCIIRYEPSTKKYAIKDQGDGSGTFAKVEGDVKVKSGYILSFGDSHMIINVSNERDRIVDHLNDSSHEKKSCGEEVKNTDRETTLTLKFLDGPKIGEVLKFQPEDGVVKVGRILDCQVRFEGNNLSRYQCSFKYQDGLWYLRDGLDKPSTNGTWIFLDNFYDIVPGLIIKIGQTLFKADIIN